MTNKMIAGERPTPMQLKVVVEQIEGVFTVITCTSNYLSDVQPCESSDEDDLPPNGDLIFEGSILG